MSSIIDRHPATITTLAKATAAAEAINAIGEDVATVITIPENVRPGGFAMVKVEDRDGNEMFL